ncbi:hypothetical protein GQ457_16G016440 [Hibiscus cannabinus]
MQEKRSNFDDNNQGKLILPTKGSEGEGGHITTWKFDQDASRKALAEMIVIGELPFKFVESEGFRRFMSVACPSHKGEAIGTVIEKSLLSWGIEKLFIITVDNASSNDVAINYLRKKFNPRGGCIANGKYLFQNIFQILYQNQYLNNLHMRYMTHIVNLIVVEGLKEMNKSVSRVRGCEICETISS